ncbi:hypothetical protein KAH43_01525 [Candidatus Bipolaricaulota bacterium]|nr:hypothetical protein [Candidatus Bipolaricaulota bacterium]
MKTDCLTKEKMEYGKGYLQWLVDIAEVDARYIAEARYDSVVAKMRSDISGSSLWSDLTAGLPELSAKYLLETGYPLLTSKEHELLQKPFDSFLHKSYRKNVLLNSSWDEPPLEGWITPLNWWERTKDVVRTQITVKYLDGVERVVELIRELCVQQEAPCEITYEARDDGYYAAHAVVGIEADIPQVDWDTIRVCANLEIQVTTQLQEVIKRLLHKYYEQQRGMAKDPLAKRWQWNYASEEFVANYLGHILHYVEGMIMDVREKQRGE